MSGTSRKVLVAGAAAGIGEAIVKRLAAAGFTLALAGRERARLEPIARAANAAWFGEMDVTEEAQVEAAIREASAKLGGLDVVVYLPGLSVPGKIEQMALDAYDRMLDVNVKGAFLVSKHFMAQCAADPGDRGPQIVLVGSMAGKRANPAAPIYCTAKAAVNMLAQGLALQAKEKGVRVTVMNPGAVDTVGFWGNRPVPREKFMKADDVAGVAEFLLTMPRHVVVHEIAFEPFEHFRSVS